MSATRKVRIFDGPRDGEVAEIPIEAQPPMVWHVPLISDPFSLNLDIEEETPDRLTSSYRVFDYYLVRLKIASPEGQWIVVYAYGPKGMDEWEALRRILS